ncbi:hypothetical protein [Ancylobacter rudongensis]|uniref:Hpr(Ser) kinase/phosphatase n=1 Tax=Ancylobacter rudongensis TaxID=177413 RepID=A0A1G4RQQ6_9HYPH|nr:hypothetical protein [Ancylobacter rudongensis]SCW59057.1 hypothetical protein SAMN05660859_1841 [Ancylobacter rudongensis]
MSSEIALPARMEVDPAGEGPVDVVIDVGHVPSCLDHPTHRGATWMANDQAFLLDLPDIGRFLCEDGQRITVCPAPVTSLDDILVFVTGTALGAILYQRKGLLLHASAVVRDGRAFLFCGQSGAGKSTLAAALMRSGCDILADDVCAVEENGDRPPMIHSDGRALRLYADSIDQVGLSDAVGARVRRRLEKFHVAPPMPDNAPESVPLAAVYMLADADTAFPPGIDRLPTLEAAQSLLHHTYRRQLAQAYCGHGMLALRTAALLSRIPVFSLRRPRELARLQETVTQLRSHWDRLGSG